jgi:hypothetical protein
MLSAWSTRATAKRLRRQASPRRREDRPGRKSLAADSGPRRPDRPPARGRRRSLPQKAKAPHRPVAQTAPRPCSRPPSRPPARHRPGGSAGRKTRAQNTQVPNGFVSRSAGESAPCLTHLKALVAGNVDRVSARRASSPSTPIHSAGGIESRKAGPPRPGRLPRPAAWPHRPSRGQAPGRHSPRWRSAQPRCGCGRPAPQTSWMTTTPGIGAVPGAGRAR